MKVTIFIILFPIFLYAQNDRVSLSKIKLIDLQIKYIDSIANFIEEEKTNGVWKALHGTVNGKNYGPLYTNTSTLRDSNKVIRVCYSERDEERFADWHIYLSDGKIIYIEIISGRPKKKKVKIKQLYFEDEILIYPKHTSKFTYEDEANVFFKAKLLFK